MTGVQRHAATVPENVHYSAARGEPLEKFWLQGSERPNHPTHAYRHRGGVREVIWDQAETTTSPGNVEHLVNRGEPLAEFFVARY